MKFFLPIIALFILSGCSNSSYSKLESVYAQQKYGTGFDFMALFKNVVPRGA
jgi:hypothetical protein